MKAKDFRREHFEKGWGFAQADFDAYIEASDRLAKTSYTRFLPCVAGGILVSFLFSKGIGGFAGNMLAVLCIFAGLIIGGVFNVKAGRAVRERAEKLGITAEDVAAAKRHVQNGTVAWSGAYYPAAQTGAAFQPAQDASAWNQAYLQEEQPEESLPENPMRAVWVAVLSVFAWFALILIQCAFGPRLFFSLDALFFCVAALVGTGAYLITRPGIKNKLMGGGAGLIAVILSGFNIIAAQNYFIFMQKPRLGDFLNLQSIAFFRNLGGLALCVALSLGAAWLVSALVKSAGKKSNMRLAGGAAAIVFLIGSLIRSYLGARFVLGQMALPNVFSVFAGGLYDAVCLYLVCMAVYALCNLPSVRVKLRGLGLAWGWLATVGMLSALAVVVSAAVWRRNGGITFSAQLILALAGLTGYILLLCGRRVGLFVILLGAGTMLGAQFAYSLEGAIFGANQFILPLVSTVIGAVNPLFAYLAARAGSREAVSAPVRYTENRVSAFQKIAAVLCVAAGAVGILFPVVTMINGEEFVSGMAIYIAISAVIAGLGVFLLVRQNSATRIYGKGLRVLGAVAFGLAVALLLLSVAGIVMSFLL